MAPTCRPLSTATTAAAAAALAVAVALAGAPAAAVRCALPSTYVGNAGVVSIEAEWQVPTHSSQWSLTSRVVKGHHTTFVVYKAGNMAHRVDAPPRGISTTCWPFPLPLTRVAATGCSSAPPPPTKPSGTTRGCPSPTRTGGCTALSAGGGATTRRGSPSTPAPPGGGPRRTKTRGDHPATFNTFTVDHNPSVLVTRWLRRGHIYTLRVAGRSSRWALDRIVLFRCSRRGRDECVFEDTAAYQAAVHAPRSQCHRW
eukprot:TRINITY_DN3126_c0_g2_i1.p2 TRINITY_DN3126_c0_g2~~TRINITY_DN3126_c0_g2_i1.p2  ORF type:complete len:256 (+),score=27.51 TRINITY_DN3126_c0_g2_i1:374-1141(+)